MFYRDEFAFKIGSVKLDRKIVPLFIYKPDHNPPHIHVGLNKGQNECSINIKTGKIYRGKLAPRHVRVIAEWLAENMVKVKNKWNELNPSMRMDSARCKYGVFPTLINHYRQIIRRSKDFCNTCQNLIRVADQMCMSPQLKRSVCSMKRNAIHAKAEIQRCKRCIRQLKRYERCIAR